MMVMVMMVMVAVMVMVMMYVKNVKAQEAWRKVAYRAGGDIPLCV